MALQASVTHSTAADGTFSSEGATAWNAAHAIVFDESSVNITGGTITGVTGVGYCITALTGLTNPSDGATVYFGQQGAGPQATENTFRIRFPIAGTIIAITLDVGVAGTLGTTEDTTASFRFNATTDTAISAVVKHSAANQGYIVTGLSIAVTANSTGQIKLVFPTFATNPTNVIYAANIFVRT